jgi:16S rRNA C967 or C1407 C5-methylase (RsmB/RsmF family)
MNLPESFTNRIKTQLGDDYDAYMNCLDQGMHHGLRVNTNKISVEDFLKISPFELKPVPWTTNGFYYDDKACTPSKHPYYYAGLYYIQEPSAMAPASILPVEDGDVVLDICAAPGGKSTELAAKLHGTGFLISNDISNSRAKALLKNLELFGIGNMCVVSEAPNKLSTKFYQTFDKILIDAPCSGEGMFRKSQSMVTAWENNGVELFAGLQRGILNEVVKMLKPGGTMLYSTCTFSPEENEQSIEYLLSLDDTLELVEVPKYPGFCNGNPAWGKTENAKGMPKDVKRSMYFMLVSIFLWFTAYNAVTTAFSRYTKVVWKMEGGSFANCLMVATVAAIFSYIPIGSISAKIGRKKTIMGGVLLMAACYGAAIFAREYHPIVNVAFALIGVAWAAINVNSYPMIVAMSSGSDVGKFTGTYYTFSMAAQILTPVLSGFLLEKVSYNTLFPYALFFSLMAFLTMTQVHHGDVKPQKKESILENFDVDD